VTELQSVAMLYPYLCRTSWTRSATKSPSHTASLSPPASPSASPMVSRSPSKAFQESVQFSLATEVGALSQRLKNSADWKDSAVLEETKQFRESETPLPAGDAAQEGGVRLGLVLGGTAVLVVGGLIVSRVVGLAWLCKRRTCLASGRFSRVEEEAGTTPTGQVSSLSLGNDLLWEARWRSMTHDL
jgi:hypothetical protein